MFWLNTRLELLKDFTDDKNSSLWDGRLGTLSGVLFHSLFDNLIVTLSWLYASLESDEKRSLRWYLCQVKEHSKVFTEQELNTQLQTIDSAEDIVIKVKTVRDKWIAHRDPKAFNKPHVFLQTYHIDISDLEKLIEIAKEILQEHSQRFDDTDLNFDAPLHGVELLVEGGRLRTEMIKLFEEIDLDQLRDDGAIKTRLSEIGIAMR